MRCRTRAQKPLHPTISPPMTSSASFRAPNSTVHPPPPLTTYDLFCVCLRPLSPPCERRLKHNFSYPHFSTILPPPPPPPTTRLCFCAPFPRRLKHATLRMTQGHLQRHASLFVLGEARRQLAPGVPHVGPPTTGEQRCFSYRSRRKYICRRPRF